MIAGCFNAPEASLRSLNRGSCRLISSNRYSLRQSSRRLDSVHREPLWIAPQRVKLETSSCSGLRPPEQLLFSAAKSSSIPGFMSSGQPLIPQGAPSGTPQRTLFLSEVLLNDVITDTQGVDVIPSTEYAFHFAFVVVACRSKMTRIPPNFYSSPMSFCSTLSVAGKEVVQLGCPPATPRSEPGG
jgi:hypothetical protein